MCLYCTIIRSRAFVLTGKPNQTIRMAVQKTNLCNDLKNTNRKDNIDSEVNRGKMLKETIEIGDNTKVRT